MKNPIKKSYKKRGLPDTGFHHGKPQHQQTNDTPTLIPVSSSAPSPLNMNKLGKLNMKKRVKKSYKIRGLSDILRTNDTLTLIRVSSPAPSSCISSDSNMESDPIIPSGYPYNSNYSPNNHPHTMNPPNAQPDQGVSSGPVSKFNTGGNKNKKGKQKTGNVRAANTVAGSGPAITFPQNGSFVFDTGNNYNGGDYRESGNVEFGNVG